MITQIISIVASIFNILSGGTYLKQVIKNESIPNPATWFIWLVVTILNASTYFLVAGGNLWISLTSIVLAVVIFSILLFSLVKGKFSRLGMVEIISLALCVAIGIFWKVTGNTIISNVSLQAIFLISFYPTFHALLLKTTREKSPPWFFASVSYILQIAIILTNPITLLALVFPVINLIGNGSIGILAEIQSRSKRFAK